MAVNKTILTHFLSVECYPAAKVGGLADVVGALPKYLKKNKCNTTVFLPKYEMKWFVSQKFKTTGSGTVVIGDQLVNYEVQSLLNNDLGFDLMVISIPKYFDRDGVYAGTDGVFFKDEVERFIAFQRSYLDYLLKLKKKPDVIHCHDHHTGLIPFMIKYGKDYNELAAIPTVFTIHNQRYQGQFEWTKQYLLPDFDKVNSGLLDWGDMINPLASAVKCSWRITTVSPSYMQELKVNSFGLEWLFNNEDSKSVGILNGIDAAVWNPKIDEYLTTNLKTSISKFKNENKAALLKSTKLDKTKPLVSFIGRFALEKGSDLLPDIIEKAIKNGSECNFLILGTGDKVTEQLFVNLARLYPKRVSAYITYNEKLSHQIYAGSDFLIMPSRVEPCGLNQMYAMKYGTIPIVNDLGGLRDSVDQVNGPIGTGFKFNNLEHTTVLEELQNAENLYNDLKLLNQIRSNAMKKDLSWTQSAKTYISLYQELLKSKTNKNEIIEIDYQ